MAYSNPGAFLMLHDALTRLKSGAGAAEAHGLLTAVLITGGHEGDWLPQIANQQDETFDVMAQESIHFLRDLAEETQQLLDDESLTFSPLIPDDEDSLYERVEGLRSWCQGFLAGLGVSPELKKLSENKEVTDTLRDIEAVSQMEPTQEASEEDERAFTDIHEFVRMAVLFIQDHIIGEDKAKKKASAPNNPQEA